MDAVAYQMSFDKEQLALLCANYDRRIDSLGAENKMLKAENTKLRELVRDLYLCSDETCTDCEHHDYSGNGFWCKRGVGWKRARMRELGVEVD